MRDKDVDFRIAMDYVASIGICPQEALLNLTRWSGYHRSGLDQFLVKIGGECTADSSLTKHLAALNMLGLYPIILHGGGKQIDEEMKSRGIIPKRVGGQRVTDAETLDCVVRALDMISNDLALDIILYGGNACALNHLEIISARPLDESLGFVGEPTYIDSKELESVVSGKVSPVLWCIGYGANGQKYNINADRVAAAVIRHCGAYRFSKVVWVTAPGGVRAKDGHIISSINYSDIDRLIADGTATAGMAEKLLAAKGLLGDQSLPLDPRFKIQIVSPGQILQELLTDKGSGTEITRAVRAQYP